LFLQTRQKFQVYNLYMCHLSKLQKSMTDPELGILSYVLSFPMAQIVYEMFHLSST